MSLDSIKFVGEVVKLLLMIKFLSLIECGASFMNLLAMKMFLTWIRSISIVKAIHLIELCRVSKALANFFYRFY